eukprot:TRINITY_DN13777_c0_g1_i2.p1 TRINITY_DN13777_c0_g1~~TRINITY_DN13777_c0_g1_i2.p1  ORF type:complete len:705 (+),score=144.35 TRINITY_DN13777_c0_g1_i2:96-2210(+)
MGAAACRRCCETDEKEASTPEEQAALMKDHRDAAGLSLPPQQVVQVTGAQRQYVEAHDLRPSSGAAVAGLGSHGSSRDESAPPHVAAPRCLEAGSGEAPVAPAPPTSNPAPQVLGHSLLQAGSGEQPASHGPQSVLAPQHVTGTSAAHEGEPATAAPALGGGTGHVQQLAELPGRRRSLLIGINYFGTSSQLSGCINDIRRIRDAIRDRYGFKQDTESQRVLLDEPGWPERPTLAKLREGIRWLAHGAQTGDALYLHYSGHGGREEDGHGGFHETLCPVDMETHGMLYDTELFEELVKPLPSGCRLTCFLDCCHSQGALDLPYVFTGTKENLDKAIAGEAKNLVMSKNWMRSIHEWQEGRSADMLMNLGSMGLGMWELYKKRQAAKEGNASGFAGSEASQNAGLSVGEVIAFTGCRSDQTSADVGDVNQQFDIKRTTQNRAGGALTAVFLESLEKLDGGADLSYLKLLDRMRERLQQEDFEQVPQLASSLYVELNQRFSLTTAFLPHVASKGSTGTSGFDATDGMLLAGGAASAAGFLATLAKAPHGNSMMSSASGQDASHGWSVLNSGGWDVPTHAVASRAGNPFDGFGGTGNHDSLRTTDHSRDAAAPEPSSLLATGTAPQEDDHVPHAVTSTAGIEPANHDPEPESEEEQVSDGDPEDDVLSEQEEASDGDPEDEEPSDEESENFSEEEDEDSDSCSHDEL